MVQATGTLAWLNEFLSDEPTDVAVVEQQATMIAIAISTMANELNEKVKQAPEITKELQEQIAQVDLLNAELARLLEIKRRLENQ